MKYKNFQFDDPGITIQGHPPKIYPWSRVVQITTTPRSKPNQSGEYQTIIRFDDGLLIQLACEKVFSSFENLQEYRRVLSMCYDKCSGLQIGEFTKLIIHSGVSYSELKEFQTNSKGHPNDVEFNKKLGQYNLLYFNLKNSRECFDKSLSSRPDDFDTVHFLGILDVLQYFSPDKAINRYKQYLDKYPENIEALATLAEILLAYPKEEGLQVAEKVLARRPDLHEIRLQLGEYYLNKQEYDKAKDQLKIIIDRGKDHPIYKLAWVFFNYVEKLILDPSFRNKEEKRRRVILIKIWAIIIFTGLFILIGVVVVLYKPLAH